MNKTTGRAETHNCGHLIGKYVIIRHRNNRIEYLANNTDRHMWTSRLHKAKPYYDLSATDVKIANLKYYKNPIIAEARYVTKNLRLVKPRRDYHVG